MHPHLAHDLRNLALVAYCGTDLALRRGDNSRLKAANLAAADMVALLKDQGIETIDVNGLVLEAAKRVDGVADLMLMLDKSRPRVLAAATSLQQALVNLVKNAEQALTAWPEARIAMTTRGEDTNVFISVSDNGPGLDRAVLADDWVSPRGPEHGQGLKSVKRQVLALGGELRVDTRSGTVFTISLPRA